MTFPDKLEHLVDLYDEIYLVRDDLNQEPVQSKSKEAEHASIKCIVLLDKPISSNEKNFLEKVLAAVSLSYQDISHERVASNSNIPVLHFTSKNEEEPFYTVLDVSGQQTLFAHELRLLMSDLELKRKLWTGLKQLFGV